MIDKIDNASQIIRNAQDKAMHTIVKYGTPRTIANVMQLIMAIFCLVGIQIVSYSFDFSILFNIAFWLKLACSTIGIILLFRAVVQMRQSSTEKRENVVKAKNEYIEANNKKKLDMKVFIKEFNLKSKTEAYVCSINDKIYKVEKKIGKAKKPSKIKKLEAKLDSLKELVKVEYIEEHIERIRIKYNEIFWTDFNDVGTYDDSNGGYLTRGTSNYNKSFTRATFKNMWLYILTSTLLAIGMPTPTDGGTLTYVTTISLTLFIIVVRVCQALLQADRIYDATITRSYIDRTSILKQYFEWQKNNPSNTNYQNELEEEKKRLNDFYKEHYKKQAEEKIREGIEQGLKGA